MILKMSGQQPIPLLTANRNAKGEDSLEQVMREENEPTSFTIITICVKQDVGKVFK